MSIGCTSIASGDHVRTSRWPWVALVLCLAFGLFRWLGGTPSARAVHLSYTQAVGYGIGQLLARDFPAGGRVLYLVPGAEETVIASQFQPHAEGMRAGFDRAGLQVEIVIGEGPRAPRRAAAEMIGISPRPLADAVAVARAHPDAVALVALVSPAELPPESTLRTLPPLYVMDPTADPRWPALLRQGLVKGVVTRNPEADLLPMADDLQPAAEVFALRYKLVSP